MQRIERYGVIALALLLVTIVAVTFWEKGEVESVVEREQSVGREAVARAEGARAERDRGRGKASVGRGAADTAPSGPSRAIDRELPATAKQDDKASQPSPPPQPKPRPKTAIASDDGGAAIRPPAGVPARGSGKPPFQQIPSGTAPAGNPRAEQEAEVAQSGRPEHLGSSAEKPFDHGETGAALSPRVSVGNTLEELAGIEKPGPMKQIPGEKKQVPGENPKPEDAPAAAGVHVVATGETLSQISEKCLGTCRRWKEIQVLNGIDDPASIYVGMKLRLPSSTEVQVKGVSAVSNAPNAANAASPPKAATPAPGGTYVVKPGDVLSVIAERELGSSKRWPEIVALNPGIDPKRLFQGAVLRLPAAGASRTEQSTVAKATTEPTPRKKNRVR